MKLEFVPVVSESDQERLAALAGRIWNEYWPALIGQDQTDYMVENFQSLKAIRRDMAENSYEYWFLQATPEGGSPVTVGYTGGHEEPETNRYFISKIYLCEDARGQGFARRTVDFYDELCRDRGLRVMYLTVNKHNDLGVRAYLGTGFSVIDAVETDIGNGFVMDDFIMERPASA